MNDENISVQLFNDTEKTEEKLELRLKINNADLVNHLITKISDKLVNVKIWLKKNENTPLCIYPFPVGDHFEIKPVDENAQGGGMVEVLYIDGDIEFEIFLDDQPLHKDKIKKVGTHKKLRPGTKQAS